MTISENPTNTDPALIISIFSLLTSLATLFVSYLRPAKIKCNFGPTTTLFYDIGNKLSGNADGKAKGNVTKKQGNPLYIYIPTTFINSGSKAGSIFRIAVALYNKANPDQTYYMQWRAFCSYHRETGIWGEDELAHEVSINGNSTLAKWISFYWGLNPGIDILEGTYIIDIYYWNKINAIPQQERHELHISNVNLLDIKKNRKGNRNMVELALDEKNRPNNLTSQTNIGNLLDENSKSFINKTNQIALGSVILGGFSYVAFYLAENFITKPYHVMWWQNPKLITLLLTVLPFAMGCLLAGMMTLSRFWASRKIMGNMRNGRIMSVVQLVVPLIGIAFGVISIFYALSLF